MPDQTRIVSPGQTDRLVKTTEGIVLEAPHDWSLLPPGDATLTRRVKAAGPTWTIQQKKGRKTFSLGVWASTETIEEIHTALEAERSTDQYKKRRQSDLARREKKHNAYVGDFHQSVLQFLNFDPQYTSLAKTLADRVTAHATPVGSGTVARTERIPIERRAESAVIAWLRHATTSYDDMKIPRIKGKRREVRRMLAEKSRQLLHAYRTGQKFDSATCPLQIALNAEA